MAAPIRPGRQIATGETIVVEGLTALQRALRLAEGNADKNLRKRLRKAAEPVRSAARANVTHRTGRHGNSGPRLASSIRIGVNARSVSVYSSAIHAIVQDQGGQVGRNRATLLKRSEVSQYMTRAVQQKQATITKEVNAVLDDVARDFEKG